MEELIDIDGRKYRLSYDQPMTLEQRSQVIEDIRKSLERDIYIQQTRQVKQLDNNARKGGTALSAGMRVD